MDKQMNSLNPFDAERYDELDASELFYMEQRNNIKCAAEEAKRKVIEQVAISLYEATKDLSLVSKATKIKIKELKILLGL